MTALLHFYRIFVLILLPLLIVPGIDLRELHLNYRQLKGEERIKAGLQICDSLTGNPEELLRFALPLLKEAERLVPGTLLMAKVYRQVSDGYFFSDSITLSNDLLLKAIGQAEALDPVDTLFLGSAYNDLGMNLQDLGRRAEARRYLIKAIQYLEASGLQENIADAKSNLASLSYAEGKYEEAIALYNEAYRIDLGTGNTHRQSTSLNNLGRIYVDWGKYDTGLDFYFRSAALLDSVNDRKTMAVRYNNIGMAYQLMKRHTEAIRWIEKARIIDEGEAMFSRLGTRYFNLANSYSALGNFSKAKFFFVKADSFYSATGQIPALAKVHAGFGQMYLEQGNDEQALLHLQKSLSYAETGGSLPERSMIYNQFYKLYKKTGRFDEALHFYELYTSAKDSVFNRDVSSEVEELEIQYRTAQKEAEISRLESENELHRKEVSFRKRERNWAFAGLALVLAFLAGLYALFRTVKQQKTMLEMQNQELERLNQTQNRLFSIISHDLRNAMAAYQSSAKVIAYHLERGQPDKLVPLAPDIRRNAQHLSGMLENLLQWSLMQMKGIEPEKKLIRVSDEAEKVLELMKDSAKAKSIVMSAECGEETVWCDPGSLDLILRNIVGNAVKFTSGGKITLQAFSNDGHTRVQVSDTGTGMDPDMVSNLFDTGWKKTGKDTNGEKGTGLGLLLVAEHVEKNNGTIEVKSQPGVGTTFSVTLPSGKI